MKATCQTRIVAYGEGIRAAGEFTHCHLDSSTSVRPSSLSCSSRPASRSSHTTLDSDLRFSQAISRSVSWSSSGSETFIWDLVIGPMRPGVPPAWLPATRAGGVTLLYVVMHNLITRVSCAHALKLFWVAIDEM